jgi:predicted ArsR family transcriptional regulator
MDVPSERELKILELLSSGDAATQREVANAVGVSLGLVNAVLRRLAKTGHLKIQNLNAKKVRYILTRKGIAEKSRRSYDYVKRTLHTYNTCLERIRQLIDNETRRGRDRFLVVGDGDIAELVVVALQLKAANGVSFERRRSADGEPSSDVCILNCGEPAVSDIGISVLGELLMVGGRR